MELAQTDAFGLRPSQRAYECYLLLGHKDATARASACHLLTAELLMAPELLLKGAIDAHAEQGEGALELRAIADPNLFRALFLPAGVERTATAIGAWLRHDGIDAALKLAALVALSMLVEPAQRDLRLEAATNRLLARCVCIILMDEDDQQSHGMRDALRSARLRADGNAGWQGSWTLLLAASHKGNTAIVRKSRIEPVDSTASRCRSSYPSHCPALPMAGALAV